MLRFVFLFLLMISLSLYALYLGLFEERDTPRLLQNLRSYKDAAKYKGLSQKTTNDGTEAAENVKA